VRIAEAPPRGGFGTPIELTADGTLRDVALRADGAALAAWTEHGRIETAVHGRDAAFRRAEPAPAGERPLAVAAGFDASGRPLLAWVAGRPARLHVATRG
jgi:hypothetical protein